MAMTTDGRAAAIYASIAANNPRVAQMTTDEANAIQTSIKRIFGADLSYIQGNAEIPGAQYQAPSTACTVTTATGPASGTTIAATVSGTGKVF